jgi:hypothetical protein
MLTVIRLSPARASQKMSVGGDGDVQRFTRRIGAELGKTFYQTNDVLAQQWLAAGQPYLLNAQADENPDDAEIILHCQLGKLGALGSGAAINALVVAAVGDGDTKVGNAAAEFVPQANCGLRVE